MRSLKAYRQRFLQKIVLDIEAGNESKINVLEAINIMDWAWQDVSQIKISNCFSAALSIISYDEERDLREKKENDKVGFEHVQSLFDKLPEVTIEDCKYRRKFIGKRKFF